MLLARYFTSACIAIANGGTVHVSTCIANGTVHVSACIANGSGGSHRIANANCGFHAKQTPRQLVSPLLMAGPSTLAPVSLMAMARHAPCVNTLLSKENLLGKLFVKVTLVNFPNSPFLNHRDSFVIFNLVVILS